MNTDADRQSLSLSLSRREFLETLGGGLVVLVAGNDVFAADQHDDQRLQAWLQIDAGGQVTGLTGKVEYGQGTRTGFAQVIAEELSLPIDRVRIVMGDTDVVPFDIGTFASLSTEVMRPHFQRAAARAGVLLKRRAAQQWNVPVEQCRLRQGKVFGPGDRSADIGALVKNAPLIDVLQGEYAPKPADEYTLVGKSVPRIDGLELVTGQAVFGTDFTVPGLLHGAILRPPYWGARLTRLDAAAAEALPGVVKIVRKEDFVGVVAETEKTARDAVTLLQAEWDGQADVDDAKINAQLAAACPTAEVVHQAGEEDAAWRKAKRRHRAVYKTSFVYHATLEPQAATASVKEGEAWIWGSVQRPFAIRKQIAGLLKLPEQKVHVKVTAIGGGFGRKNNADSPREAALLSQSVGRPVRVVWSREEDFRNSTFRPAARMEAEAGLSADGRLVVWDYCKVSAGGRFSSTRDVQSFYPSDFHRTRFSLIRSGVRDGSFRGLGSPINAFARESFMDELAFAAGIDPLEFRLQTLGDHMPRLSAVLRAVAKQADWQPRTAPRKDGIGFGLACCLYREKTYVAEIAKIRVDESDGRIQVEKVTAAIDCGFVVNPDGIRKQAEGGVAMAVSYCLGEAIHIEGSAVANDSFRKYPLLRIDDAPAVETVFVGDRENPSVGVGEPVTVPVAAALANAYFDATGRRLRKLPLG